MVSKMAKLKNSSQHINVTGYGNIRKPESLHTTVSKNHFRKKPTDSKFAIVILSVITVYVWILLITYYMDNKFQSKLVSVSRKGFTFSLEKQISAFDINGFEYFPKNPVKRRPKLMTSTVWFLRPLQSGSITIRDLFKHLNRPTQVSVLIKYFVSAPRISRLTVSGTNSQSHEIVMTDMSQYGEGFCTRVIFLGLVHEVNVEAFVPKNGGFVIIDELLIGLGYFVFDGLDEETCSL